MNLQFHVCRKLIPPEFIVVIARFRHEIAITKQLFAFVLLRYHINFILNSNGVP
jgi:hypothetical protein